MKALAEITLVLVLFSDASRVRLRDLRAETGLFSGCMGKPAAPAVSVIAFTVLLSVVAHGLTANPLAHRYGPRLAITPGRPDDTGVPPLPARRLIRRVS